MIWKPIGGRPVYNPGHLSAGQIIALDCDGLRHSPWRIEAVTLTDDGRYSIQLRPHGVDLAAEQAGRCSVSAHRHGRGLYVLEERYPVCSHCHQLMPCSDSYITGQMDAAVQAAARFETPGVCPSCMEPVTSRQRSITFETNLHVPLGPPVTFHTRTRCVEAARRYDEQVAESTGCRPVLSCAGALTRHVGLVAVCTDPECPGPHAWHASVTLCAGRRHCPLCREPDPIPADPATIARIRKGAKP